MRLEDVNKREGSQGAFHCLFPLLRKYGLATDQTDPPGGPPGISVLLYLLPYSSNIACMHHGLLLVISCNSLPPLDCLNHARL
jgi:hypothetical protein